MLQGERFKTVEMELVDNDVDSGTIAQGLCIRVRSKGYWPMIFLFRNWYLAR
jgi:hypothetical protein